MAGLGWAGLGWAGLGWGGGLWALGWAGCGLWAGLAVGWLGWAWAGWVGNPETEIGLFELENGKVCLHRKNELPDGQQQQAISIYFFLEG